MELKYDIPKYIAKTKMSSKKTILVEGKDDKSHVKNLLDIIEPRHKVRIDTADSIKGVCSTTAKNNRAKIDRIFNVCKTSECHQNLFFLIDREFFKFEIREKIHDLMPEHETDGNLSWTIGHSIENYFFVDNIFSDAYRYLCGSQHKTDAEKHFKKILPSIFKLVAAITLAANEMSKSSYPAGVISWKDFNIEESRAFIDIDSWKNNDETQIALLFRKQFKKYIPIVEASEDLICSRICRGHTAMLMIQRIFSACLYYVMFSSSEEQAENDANNFSNIKETNVSAALCEAWIRKAKNGEALYPAPLICAVA